MSSFPEIPATADDIAVPDAYDERGIRRLPADSEAVPITQSFVIEAFAVETWFEDRQAYLLRPLNEVRGGRAWYSHPARITKVRGFFLAGGLVFRLQNVAVACCAHLADATPGLRLRVVRVTVTSLVETVVEMGGHR